MASMASIASNVQGTHDAGVVTLKTFNGTDIRRITVPARSLQDHDEIVGRVCEVYGLDEATFRAQYGLELVADGWAAPRLVRSEADLRAVPELALGAARPSQLIRARILVNFDEPAAAAARPAPADAAPKEASPEDPASTTTSCATREPEKRPHKVMRVNKEAIAALRESFKSARTAVVEQHAAAKEGVHGMRQEVRALRLKLKEACRQARLARAEGDVGHAKEEKETAKETVKAARERLMEAETHLADCKGRVRRVKEQFRAEILEARTEAAASSTTASSGSDTEVEAVSVSAPHVPAGEASPAPATDALQTGCVVVLQAMATMGMVNVVRDAATDLTATGHRGRPGRFLVTRCDDLVQFQSRLSGSYLRIDKESVVSAKGSGGFCTWFRPVAAEDGTVALQSVFMEKKAGKRVFLSVTGSKESSAFAALEDASLPPASRFRVICMRNIGTRGEATSSSSSGEGASTAAAPKHESEAAAATEHSFNAGIGIRHGRPGGFCGFKRARVAELQRENALLQEENARLREENARLRSGLAGPCEAPPTEGTASAALTTGAASASFAIPAPAPTSCAGRGDYCANNVMREKLGKRRARAEEHAAKGTPESVSAGDTVFLQSQTTHKNLRIRKAGKVDGNGHWGGCAQLRVVGADNDVVQLTNSKDSRVFLCLSETGVLGASDKAGPSTWFRIIRHSDGLCSLRSVAHPDFIVGVVASGEAKALGDPEMNMDAAHGRFRLTLK